MMGWKPKQGQNSWALSQEVGVGQRFRRQRQAEAWGHADKEPGVEEPGG